VGTVTGCPTTVAGSGDVWHLDELFVTIRGERQYLWRAVDQDGDVLGILLQSRRSARRSAVCI